MDTRRRYIPWLVRLAFAVVTLVSGTNALRAKDVVVREDGGGVIIEYVGKYEMIAKRGDRVVIDGWCASACTIALHYPRTCVTKRATLGFHQAYYNILGVHIIAKGDTDLLYSYYPPQIKKWIEAHGGLKPGLMIMGPKTAAKLLPSCERLTS